MPVPALPLNAAFSDFKENQPQLQQFRALAEQYINSSLSENNEEKIGYLMNSLARKIPSLDCEAGLFDFIPLLEWLEKIVGTTQSLLVKARPGSEMQKELIRFFDAVYQARLIIHHIFARRTFERLAEAFKNNSTEEILGISAIFAKVGTPDFQLPLWSMIKKAKDLRIKKTLISVLGKTGNQSAANLVYTTLHASPEKVYLDALVDLGLPAFEHKQKKKKSTLKRLISKETPDRNMKRFYRNFRTFRQELERIFQTLNLNDEEKDYYRQAIFQTRGKEKKIGDYTFLYRGISFKEGDVVFTLNVDPISRWWGTVTSHPVGFDHVSLITFSRKGFPLVADVGSRVRLTHLEDALSIRSDFLVLRLKNMNSFFRQRVNRVINLYYKNRMFTKYDGNFDYKTDLSFYCSEFVYHVFRHAAIPLNWVYSELATPQAKINMAKLGILHERFITHGDYLRMPEFSYVGSCYNKSLEARVVGGMLVDVYLDNFKTKELDLKRIPNKTRYRTMAKLFRFANVRSAKQFPSNMEFALVAFFETFGKTYKKIRERMKKERIELTDYSSYKRRLKEIIDQETEDLVASIFHR
ncbi:MAG: YiiX/YebB-like N1pC/P60 family cysteine hydrolase [Candidatus Aminicenantales bacterium]